VLFHGWIRVVVVNLDADIASSTVAGAIPPRCGDSDRTSQPTTLLATTMR
jgi:hypothetical protein